MMQSWAKGWWVGVGVGCGVRCLSGVSGIVGACAGVHCLCVFTHRSACGERDLRPVDVLFPPRCCVYLTEHMSQPLLVSALVRFVAVTRAARSSIHPVTVTQTI